MTNTPKLASRDEFNQIIVDTGIERWAINAETAKVLVSQLNEAIEQVEQTPFQKWFDSLPASVSGVHAVCGMTPLTKPQAQQLWDSIRNWK